MTALAHLKKLIESKSGAPPLSCEISALRSHFGFDPAAMRRDGYDPSTIELHEQYYARLEEAAEHPLIAEYLTTLTPTEGYEASGISVVTLQWIRESTFGFGAEDENPEARLFVHGYIPIAIDGGGNTVSIQFPSGRVVFADHEYTEDIVEGDVKVLSEDLASFLEDLLHDRLTKMLRNLDSADDDEDYDDDDDV